MLKYFIFTGTIFILSITILYMTIFNIDPLGVQKNIGIILLFLSLFLGITSFFTLLFFFGKELLHQRHLGPKSFYISMRRAVLIGCFVLSISFLQLFRLLDIYETILLATFFALIEYILSTNKNSKSLKK